MIVSTFPLRSLHRITATRTDLACRWRSSEFALHLTIVAWMFRGPPIVYKAEVWTPAACRRLHERGKVKLLTRSKQSAQRERPPYVLAVTSMLGEGYEVRTRLLDTSS
eukprot:6189942-Pleurochrysis_carterae.AAC.2